jgi:hypothetical protein
MTCCWDLCCWDLSGSTNNSYQLIIPVHGPWKNPPHRCPSVPVHQSLTRLVPLQPILSRRVFGITNQHRKKSAGVSIFGLSRALFGSCDHPDRQARTKTARRSGLHQAVIHIGFVAERFVHNEFCATHVVFFFFLKVDACSDDSGCGGTPSSGVDRLRSLHRRPPATLCGRWFPEFSALSCSCYVGLPLFLPRSFPLSFGMTSKYLCCKL